jgi:putative transcriptional regulator
LVLRSISTLLVLSWLSVGLFSPGVLTAELEESETLEGSFLVASSRMPDPRFRESVILLIEQNAEGSLGLIVNKRTEERTSLNEVLDALGLPVPIQEREIWVYFGGPVQLDTVFILHTIDLLPETSRIIADGVAFSRDPKLLQKIAEGLGPKRFLLIMGYSGWGPGQLEMELRTGSWITIDADPALVFSEDPRETWQKVIEDHTMRL